MVARGFFWMGTIVRREGLPDNSGRLMHGCQPDSTRMRIPPAHGASQHHLPRMPRKIQVELISSISVELAHDFWHHSLVRPNMSKRPSGLGCLVHTSCRIGLL